MVHVIQKSTLAPSPLLGSTSAILAMQVQVDGRAVSGSTSYQGAALAGVALPSCGSRCL